MSKTEYGSQPIKTAKQIFKEAYEAKTGKVCDDTILEHMSYAIEAMEVYRSQYQPLSPEDIERAAKEYSSNAFMQVAFITGANFAKQHHKLGK